MGIACSSLFLWQSELALLKKISLNSVLFFSPRQIYIFFHSVINIFALLLCKFAVINIFALLLCKFAYFFINSAIFAMSPISLAFIGIPQWVFTLMAAKPFYLPGSSWDAKLVYIADLLEVKWVFKVWPLPISSKLTRYRSSRGGVNEYADNKPKYFSDVVRVPKPRTSGK